MKIVLVTPARPGSRQGNRVTALRWARLLRDLGHRVQISQQYGDQSCDLLIALHARRSFDSIKRLRHRHPTRPLIVGLTGTDLYQDIHTSTSAQQSLAFASRLVLLQPLGLNELPERLRSKARVIYQSVEPPKKRSSPKKHIFEVCVIGHLRPVKDPFRAALAARQLPPLSNIRIVHLGAALSREMKERALAEMSVNPRYHWLGDVPRWKSLRLLGRSRALVLTSKLEGGANVISEAIAVSVPVISSRIDGSVGLLGPDYPGYFPVGDTRALASLLERIETDVEYYAMLKSWCERLKPLVDPARERESWRELLCEIFADEKKA